MKKQFQAMGLTSDDFDEAVHEAASLVASRANNDGMEAQLALLREAGYDDAGIASLVLKELLVPGMELDVDDPRHECSVHNCAFTGIVVRVDDECVAVRDPEDDVWDVGYDEVLEYRMVS